MVRKTPAKKTVPPEPIQQIVIFTPEDSDRELWTAVQEELATASYEDFSDLCKVALEQFLFSLDTESSDYSPQTEFTAPDLSEALHQLQQQIQDQIHPPLIRIEQLLTTPSTEKTPRLDENLVTALTLPLTASLKQMEHTLETQVIQISEPLLKQLNVILQHTATISTEVKQQNTQFQQQFIQLERTLITQETQRSQALDQQLDRLAQYLTALEAQRTVAPIPDPLPAAPAIAEPNLEERQGIPADLSAASDVSEPDPDPDPDPSATRSPLSLNLRSYKFPTSYSID